MECKFYNTHYVFDCKAINLQFDLKVVDIMFLSQRLFKNLS